MKIAVLFPGQGSQFLGMGREFAEQDPRSAEILTLAESVCGVPLRRICEQGPMEELTRAAVLQPAITATNLMCLSALRQALPATAAISCYAGHSLGEYSALCAAGVLGVEQTIRLVERRGFFMEREGLKNPGGMRAVLGLPINRVEDAVAAAQANGVVTVANYNTAEQIVISGSEAGLVAASEALDQQGGKVIELNVGVANHSPLVAGSVADFSAVMAKVEFHPPRAPVYFNVTAATESEPAMIKEMMARQIASRVRWYESITRMLEDGVDTFIEVGPKNVLKGMLRKIVPKSAAVSAHQFDTPAGLEKVLATL